MSASSGPAYFESYLVFPNTSRFILDVNLGNNSVAIAQNQIEAGFKYLGKDRIFAIQLGNEPDHYGRAGWSSAAFTATFLVRCGIGLEEIGTHADLV
jgi:hypothetical protein